MKKILLLLLTCCFVTMASAQLQIGLHGSWNRVDLNLENISSSPHSGSSYGVYARIGKKFYLEPSLVYTVNKVDIQGSTVKFKTADIPLLVGYKLINFSPVGLRIFAGPEFSFAVDKFKSVFDSETYKYSKDLVWNIKAGAGLDLLRFSLNVYYKYSLNKPGNNIKRISGVVLELGIRIF